MTLRPWLQRVRKVLGTSSRGRSRRKCHPLPCASQTEQFESRQLLSAGAIFMLQPGQVVVNPICWQSYEALPKDDGAGDASQKGDPTSENPVLVDDPFSEFPEEVNEEPIDVETEGDMPADEVGSDLPEDDRMGDDQQGDPASDEVVSEEEAVSEFPEEMSEEPIEVEDEQDIPAEEVGADVPEGDGVGDESQLDDPTSEDVASEDEAVSESSEEMTEEPFDAEDEQHSPTEEIDADLPEDSDVGIQIRAGDPDSYIQLPEGPGFQEWVNWRNNHPEEWESFIENSGIHYNEIAYCTKGLDSFDSSESAVPAIDEQEQESSLNSPNDEITNGGADSQATPLDDSVAVVDDGTVSDTDYRDSSGSTDAGDSETDDAVDSLDPRLIDLAFANSNGLE